MQLTIVKPDNLVIKDKQTLIMALGDFALPDDLWALQWHDSDGHIEFEQSAKPNQAITVLPDWTNPVITEFDRIIEEQASQEQEDQERMLSINNGAARQKRELNRLADTDPQAALKQLINQ